VSGAISYCNELSQLRSHTPDKCVVRKVGMFGVKFRCSKSIFSDSIHILDPSSSVFGSWKIFQKLFF